MTKLDGLGSRWTQQQKALLETARRIEAELGKTVSPNKLGPDAVVALLRRRLLEELSGRGVAGGGLDELWEFCRRADCPLTAESAGAGEAASLRYVELADLPAESGDLGRLYQQLCEVELVESGKGKRRKLGLSLGRVRRRRSGLFFTPDWMAGRLAEMAVGGRPSQSGGRSPGRGLKILDPACGSGRLLLAVVRLLASGLSPGSPERGAAVREIISAGIRGIDIDPIAVQIARTELWLLADPERGPLPGLSTSIVVGDAIGGPLRGGRRSRGALDWERAFPQAVGGGRGFDAVIANPPFEVLKGFARRQGLAGYVERIRRSGYELALYGSLNTYRLFLERSLELLRPGGRLAIVLPFGFMTDKTAAPLRAHMLRAGWIRRLESYPESARTFEGVGQSVVLLGGVKETPALKEVVVVEGGDENAEWRVSIDDLEALDSEQLPVPILAVSALDLAARLRRVNPSTLGEFAEGRVGEVDQTFYRRFMLSRPGKGLLVRGTHLAPYRANLDGGDPTERWLDAEGFAAARAAGRWKQDLESERVVQTGIVNIEARRRFVAALVPAGVFLGNSLNYWVPRTRDGWDLESANGYLLGLLNSTPCEWRFRLTSSNNNVNLYEVRSLPLPALVPDFPADRLQAFLDRSTELVRESRGSVLGTVRQITAGWAVPMRDDRAAGMLIGRVALLRAEENDQHRAAWLDAVIDHLVNWHLGMDEPDLDVMLSDVPARRLENTVETK